jgi:hypothetical protein
MRVPASTRDANAAGDPPASAKEQQIAVANIAGNFREIDLTEHK